jgi:PAS domain S-box-containing protein
MVVVGGTGEIQLVNAQAERLFGYARAELLGQSVEMLVPERQRLAHIGHRGGFLAQPRARVMGSRMDLRARRKDGSEFPTEISLSPVEGGNEVMIIGAIRDITEQKHAEETARARERFIRTITDNIPAAVTYVDREERYRFVNKAYADWLGMAKESIEGHTVREIIGERAYAALGPTVLARAFAGETVRYERTQPVPAGGPRELAVTLIPDGDAQSGVIGQYAFIEDVTESKRLARLKNEFISTVSHELRTPLTSIRGSLGLLDGGVAGALGGRAKNLVALARQNCDRLIRLINDILDMEKIEAGKMVFVMKPVALMELIEEAIAANEGYAQAHDTRFVVTAALADARVRGDRDRLMQVLTNLLSNAAKFSPPGASVDIAVERRGEGIRVSVIDHGPGISKEFQERIFEKFSQADSSDARKKGGSGLGLAISKAIVEKHAGELAFTTRKGEGTTFYFELPELSERAERGAPPRPDSKPDRVLVYTNEREAGRRLADAVTQAGFLTDVSDNKEDAERLFGSRKYVAVALTGAEADLLRDVLVEPASERKPSILHVEDDADMRQVIAAHLDRFGKVNGAATLAEARERLAREHYDLLLLDIGLPDGSAWSLVEELQAQPSWPRIVVFSAEAVAPERRARVDAALQKSRDSEVRLVETVKSVLAQGEVRKG